MLCGWGWSRRREHGGREKGRIAMSKIVVVTEVPRFSDAGSHLRCELTSGTKTAEYYIPWDHAILALPACETALEAHLRRARNVEPFVRRGGH
jgi:hypothetical protein